MVTPVILPKIPVQKIISQPSYKSSTSVQPSIISKQSQVQTVTPSISERSEIFYQQLSPIERQVIAQPTPSTSSVPQVTEPSSTVSPTVTPSTSFLKFYAPGYTLLSQRSQYASGQTSVPSWVSKQITVPSIIGVSGAVEPYKQLSYESWLGVPTQKSEEALTQQLTKSYYYMSTQPIWRETETSDKLVSFSELKKKYPALYLVQKPSGEWFAEYDIKRWSRESISKLGGVEKAGLAFGESVTGVFDPGFWLASDKELYAATRRYQTMLEVSSGDWVKPWVGRQAAAWENVILPYAGGFAFGKVFTTVRLAGGFGKVGLGLKTAYAGGVALGVSGVVLTGSQMVSDVKAGDWDSFSVRWAKLGMQLFSGGVGYRAGVLSATKSFQTRFPNIYWGVEGKPIPESKTISFMKESVFGKGVGGKKAVVSEYGFVKLSQLYKPSYQRTYDINFPSGVRTSTYWLSAGKQGTVLKYPVGEGLISRVSPVKQFISFPESPGPFGARGEVSMLFGSSGIRSLATGVQMGTSKYIKTGLGGVRAWSSKSAWGMGKSEVIGLKDVTGIHISGTYNVNQMIRLQGKTIWSDITAAQKILPIPLLDKSQVNLFTGGFVKPTLPYIPSVYGGFVSPIKFNIPKQDYSQVFKPIVPVSGYKPLFEPFFETKQKYFEDFTPVFQTKIIGTQKTVFPFTSNLVKPIFEPVFDIKTDLVKFPKPVFDFKTELIVTPVYEYTPQFRAKPADFGFKTPVFVTPFIPPLLGGYGVGAGRSLDKIFGVGYRFRKHRVPTLEDFLGITKKFKNWGW